VRGGRFVDVGRRRSADGGRDAATFEQWILERRVVAVLNRGLLNGGVGVQGGAECLKFGKEGFAFLIGFSKGTWVVKVFATIHKVEASNGFQKGTNSNAEEAVLLGTLNPVEPSAP